MFVKGGNTGSTSFPNESEETPKESRDSLSKTAKVLVFSNAKDSMRSVYCVHIVFREQREKANVLMTIVKQRFATIIILCICIQKYYDLLFC